MPIRLKQLLIDIKKTKLKLSIIQKNEIVLFGTSKKILRNKKLHNYNCDPVEHIEKTGEGWKVYIGFDN